jgi:hypothetical protein
VQKIQFPLRIVFSVIKKWINNSWYGVRDGSIRIFLPCQSQARKTLGENSSLPFLSRIQLLPTLPYLRDTLVIVGKQNPCVLAPTTTILLPSHVTYRHRREREGVQWLQRRRPRTRRRWAAQGKEGQSHKVAPNAQDPTAYGGYKLTLEAWEVGQVQYFLHTRCNSHIAMARSSAIRKWRFFKPGIMVILGWFGLLELAVCTSPTSDIFFTPLWLARFPKVAMLCLKVRSARKQLTSHTSYHFYAKYQKT